MLTRLGLRNFVLVKQTDIAFADGLNVLTGETGAGKSVLVGALSILAGGRGGGGLVSPGADFAEIEASFDLADCPSAAEWLESRGLSDENEAGEMLVRRTLSVDAKKSRAFINGRQVTLSQMADIVSLLVDICGQHAHYSLLKAAAQRDLVDAYAGGDGLAKTVAAAFQNWRRTAEHLQTASRGLEETAAKKEALQNDIAELSALNFSRQKWEETCARLTLLCNLADVAEGCDDCLRRLENEPDGAQNQLQIIVRRLEAMTRHDDTLRDAKIIAEESLTAANELSRTLSAYQECLSPDPQAQEEAEHFISEAHRLARKHRLADAAHLDDCLREKKEELLSLGKLADMEKLQKEETAAAALLAKHCARLSAKRKSGGKRFAERIGVFLRQLAMPEARVQVLLSPLPTPGAHGAEKIALQIATRKEAALGALSDVASGGELSRLGLAVQMTLAHPNPVIVFDEVDAGIGGATAAVVGRMLRALGKARQVLCVTHLPQAAAFADHHWRVQSLQTDGRRTAEIDLLTAVEQVEEIARMSGGKKITDAARRHAAELLRQAEEQG